MLPLHDLQKQFKHLYFNEDNNLLDHYIYQNGLSTKNRLQIYHNNFSISLTECLQNIYPTIQKLVGEEFFIGTATQYILQYPPTSGDIHTFGNYFAKFLANFPAAQSLPYLSEMAQFEWMHHEVFHEEDCDLFDIMKLKIVSEEKYGDIQFKLHPSARLFACKFPIIHIWKICHETNNQDEMVNLEEGGENVLIIRHHLEITFERLSAGQFALLTAFENGLIFEKACAIALQAEPEFNINSFLQKHLLCGTIVDISL